MRWFRRLRFWIQREKAAADLEEEIKQHRALAERDHLIAGLSLDDARKATALQLGNTTLARESARSIWIWPAAEGIVKDMLYAWRSLLRNRSVLAISCISIALSTGFGTTLFSVVNAVVLQPVTAEAPHELVQFWVGSSNRISWLNYKEICEGTSGVLCAGYRLEEVWWRDGGEPMRVPAQAVTSNYFNLLGIRAAQGQLFHAESEGGNRDEVVVTHAFWQRRLAARANVIGQKIVLNGHPYTISAVLPRGFRSIFGLGIAPAFYLAAGSSLRPLSQERARNEYELLGRIPEGESTASFRTRILVIAQRLERTFPNDNRDLGRVQLWQLKQTRFVLQPGESFDRAGAADFQRLAVGLCCVACCSRLPQCGGSPDLSRSCQTKGSRFDSV